MWKEQVIVNEKKIIIMIANAIIIIAVKMVDKIDAYFQLINQVFEY